MMKDEVLKRAIVACFPVEAMPGSYYIEDSAVDYHFGNYDEATNVALQKIFQLIRGMEQSAYERGKRGEPL
jgi:hypothetical protein